MLTDNDENEIAGTYADQGLHAAAFTRLARWLYRWRDAHPDDDRSDYDLLMQEYGKE